MKTLTSNKDKMKTPQQIRNEVEKGCGERLVYYEPFTEPEACGTNMYGKIIICKECENKLSILTEYDKAIKEMIEELRLKHKGNAFISLIDEYSEELLSKIGEEKQDEKT